MLILSTQPQTVSQIVFYNGDILMIFISIPGTFLCTVSARLGIFSHCSEREL